MKGVGHRQFLRLMPRAFEPPGKSVDRAAGTADHAAVGRVNGSDLHPVTEKFFQLPAARRPAWRRAGGLHQVAAHGNQRQCGIQIHYPGKAGGHIFAKAVWPTSIDGSKPQ